MTAKVTAKVQQQQQQQPPKQKRAKVQHLSVLQAQFLKQQEQGQEQQQQLCRQRLRFRL